MLQPKRYPEMMGKALVLDADPFVVLADDDNPWIEGLFMVTLVGVGLAVAQLLRGLLLTASLPPSEAMLVTFWQSLRDLFLAGAAPGTDLAALEAAWRQAWAWSASMAGLQGGISRLLIALIAPLALLIQWLVYGLVGHVTARAMGGHGKLTQTLGATALVAAPRLLLILTAIPFVAVSQLLLGAWTLLITYRAIEVVHDLSWQRATWATVITFLVSALLFAASTLLPFTLLVSLRGMMP